MRLSVDGVEFSYRSRPVLKKVRFELRPGEILSILGNNGAGKSTLLKCLNRILKPQRGTVLLEGGDLRHLGRRQIAQRVGYVPQRQEGGRVTVFDAVLLGRRPHLRWEAGSRDFEIVRRVLTRLDLEGFALRTLDELSGGELQKVLLARALAQEPRVLLLDEPTSNLDLRNQLEVLATLRRAVREEKLAAAVVLHDLNLALRFSDRFLLLKNGVVLACGGLEVMTPTNLAQVYGVPVAVERFNDVPLVVPL
ncbi:MAG TPA: ABC transporter ATP-binding protein [Firmicutes bacterium]|nr:ABC transporter ATP-binding protein [Bacillota bacterium]